MSCQRSAPASLSADKLPQTVCFSRVPGSGVHSVGHVRYRHLRFRPPGKEGLEESPAHLTMQFADAVDGAAAADRKIRHVEGFGRVLAIASSQRQKVVERNRQFLFGILLRYRSIRMGAKRSKPASTGVWVVKRLPARVTASATSKVLPLSSMYERARSNTANAA